MQVRRASCRKHAAQAGKDTCGLPSLGRTHRPHMRTPWSSLGSRPVPGRLCPRPPAAARLVTSCLLLLPAHPPARPPAARRGLVKPKIVFFGEELPDLFYKARQVVALPTYLPVVPN